jgi:hypothetical protein
VIRDISNAIRQNTGGNENLLCDDFLAKLTADISSLFAVPENDEATVTVHINSSFDEGARPIRRMLQDAEARKKGVRDEKLVELKKLASSLGDLRGSMKDVMESTLEELEQVRFEAVNRRDKEQAKARAIERKSRSLKSKAVDLDSRLKQQLVERESNEKLAEKIEHARSKWEQNATNSSGDVRANIQKELDLLRQDLSQNGSQDLDSSLDECSSLLSAVRDELAEEASEMDRTQCLVLTRPRTPLHRVTESVQTASALQAARNWIETNQKHRELENRRIATPQHH